jgi:hypothetical protein
MGWRGMGKTKIEDGNGTVALSMKRLRAFSKLNPHVL